MASKKTRELNRNIRIEDILDYFVDGNGICRTCGNNHSYQPNLNDIAYGMDIVTELFKKKRS
jgi:hypothetical protein